MIKLTHEDFLSDGDLSAIFYHRHRRALLTLTRFMYGDCRKLSAITLSLLWA
jgi:hypothetical protein